jgi:outer membrane protein assembly factor BamB
MEITGMNHATCCHTLRRLLLGVSFALAALGAVAAYGEAKDQQPWWPQFHGPLRDNISRETGLLKEWPPEGPKLLWEFGGCGKGFSGVSIADNMIFTAGDFDEVEMVIALDLSGKLLWKSPNGKSWSGPYPGSRATPTYNSGMLYHVNSMGRLAAYRARSGEEVWAVELTERFGARYGTWAMTENVVVEGDLVFCIPGGSGALAAALDKTTGATVWTNVELDETAGYCSPIVATHHGKRQLITLTQKSVVGLDMESGELLWSHPHVTPNDQNVTAPLFSDGHVFTTSGHSAGGRLLKLNTEGNAVTELWWDKELDNCHGGVVLLDGLLYGSSCRIGGKGFFAVDFATGETRYRDKKMEKLSITSADGMIYGLTDRGEFMLLEPVPDGIRVVSESRVPHESRELAYTHPIVCGGRLYVRQSPYLYVYDVRQ